MIPMSPFNFSNLQLGTSKDEENQNPPGEKKTQLIWVVCNSVRQRRLHRTFRILWHFQVLMLPQISHEQKCHGVSLGVRQWVQSSDVRVACNCLLYLWSLIVFVINSSVLFRELLINKADNILSVLKKNNQCCTASLWRGLCFLSSFTISCRRSPIQLLSLLSLCSVQAPAESYPAIC